MLLRCTVLFLTLVLSSQAYAEDGEASTAATKAEALAKAVEHKKSAADHKKAADTAATATAVVTPAAKEDEAKVKPAASAAVPAALPVAAPVPTDAVVPVSAQEVKPKAEESTGFGFFKKLFSSKDKGTEKAATKPAAAVDEPAKPSVPAEGKPVAERPAVEKPVAPKPVQQEVSKVPVPAGGSVSKVSHSSLGSRGMDIYLTLNNSSKAEDAVIGGEVEGANLVLVTERDGKEIEGGIMIPMPPEDSVALKSGKQFLRLSSGNKKLKSGDKVTVSLYFRRSANAKFDVVIE